MSRLGALSLLLAVAAPVPGRAQHGSVGTPSQVAESLRQAGRPWHAAETLLAAAAKEQRPNAFFVVEGAKAELAARRYDRARSLLVGQAWLEDYADGEALAILAEAEYALGQYAAAAAHFGAARERARGAHAALLAVRAGTAFDAAGQPDSAARAYAAARAAGLEAIDPWLRVRQARVSRDTALVARLLADLPPPASREAPLARARALLLAGDTARALDEFAGAGRRLEVARVALMAGDTTRARTALYELLSRAPLSDDAATGVGLALSALPPRTPAEHAALGRAMNRRGTAADARVHVERAVREGDSSAATLLLYGELLTTTGRFRDAERAYRTAARDSQAAPLAIYRRARVLVRLGDPGAPAALSGFAQTFPADTAAPTALYLLGDLQLEHGDSGAAGRWFGELIARYPADVRASVARFRLAAAAYRAGQLDSAAALYQSEVDAPGPQRAAARFWLGKVAWARGDTAGARALWLALAREDSTGYYGVRARRETGLPPLRIAAAPLPPAAAPVLQGLARLDTLRLAGLDTAAEAEVRAVLARPPHELDALLAWSDGLALRGFGSAAVRLAWVVAARAPGDMRALRAIYPWPNRRAVEAEAAEFGVDPLLLVAIVRQESVFDIEALSPAGARGLAQLLPETAALTARGMDVTLHPDWITLPDLNLHLGAAHLAELVQRFEGRLEAAIAAYNAGPVPVRRWLARTEAVDADQFIELIPYQETRGYVRSVLRNRALYAALYGASTN